MGPSVRWDDVSGDDGSEIVIPAQGEAGVSERMRSAS